MVASSPRIQMAYRTSIGDDGDACEGKAAGDYYLKLMRSLSIK